MILEYADPNPQGQPQADPASDKPVLLKARSFLCNLWTRPSLQSFTGVDGGSATFSCGLCVLLPFVM